MSTRQQVPKSISLEETKQYFKYMEINGLTSSTSLAANADENNDDQDYAFMKLLSGNRAALAAPIIPRLPRRRSALALEKYGSQAQSTPGTALGRFQGTALFHLGHFLSLVHSVSDSDSEVTIS